MSFVPLNRSQLRFIADEFWPGGGENDDGRDLYGVAKHEGVWREETLDADLIAEALHPSDADYYVRNGVADMDDEEFEKWFDEDDADEDDSISVNDEPLDSFLGDHGDDPFGEFDRRPRDEYDDLPDGEDGPDSLDLAMAELQAEYRELQRRRWNEDDLVPNGAEFDGLVSSCTSEASRDLARFERDGIKQIGSRLAADMAAGWMAFERKSMMRRWNDTPKPWKRQRQTQYRLRQICPRITDPAYRNAA